MDFEEDADDPGIVAGPSTVKGAFIWKYFTKDGNKGKCNHCNKILSTPSGTTSTLARHLKTSHKVQFAAYEKEQDAKKSKDKASKQPSILSFGFQKKESLPTTSAKAKALTKNIALMLVENYLPYNLVDSNSFKTLMSKAEPRYKVPCRTTFSRNIIPKMYTATKDVIKQEIEQELITLKSISVTTDLWTSRANEGYISLTVHYMTEDFQLKKYTLATSHFPDSHTAININIKLDSLLAEWSINAATCPIYVVSDNARNMVSAINLCPAWTQIFCFANSLQLAISDAKKNVDSFAGACTKSRAIVTHYHKSSLASERLHALQMEMKKPCHELIQSVDTRWGSEFQMLARLIEQREPISAELTNSRKINNLAIAEWDLINEYVTYLEPLHQATTEMCGDTYPTMSMVIPVLTGALNVIDTLINENVHGHSGPSRLVGISFGRELRKALMSRFPLFKTNKEYLLAMVMDHRYKYVLLDANGRSVAKNFLKQEIALNTNHEADHHRPTEPVNENVSRRGLSLWDKVDDMSTQEEDQRIISVEDEISMYLKVSNQRSADPLQWWRENGAAYPRLISIARKYLSIPASQVSSERMFSTSGNVVTARRENLDPAHVEQNNLPSYMTLCIS